MRRGDAETGCKSFLRAGDGTDLGDFRISIVNELSSEDVEILILNHIGRGLVVREMGHCRQSAVVAEERLGDDSAVHLSRRQVLFDIPNSIETICFS